MLDLQAEERIERMGRDDRRDLERPDNISAKAIFNTFLRKGEVQAAADSQRFIAVLPESKSDMIFRWPFNVGDSAARQEEEFKFFDDMLSCVSEQFKANSNCVSSVGVSAGALFTSQLAQGRAQYLASAISLSGGVGEEGSGVVKPWKTPARKVPMMVDRKSVV